ncbi:hypothetical protein FHG87_021197 [Trinorchestia longiramus]|nr:hypothetical protein FHG87_021197 [Trinorchestia longiramus]
MTSAKVREGKLMEEITDQAAALGSKVTKAAQALSSGQSLTSVLMQPQHQRLEGADSAGPCENDTFKSGPERTGLLNSGRSDAGYQKLEHGRKDSWASEGWNTWANSGDKGGSDEAGKTFSDFEAASPSSASSAKPSSKSKTKPGAGEEDLLQLDDGVANKSSPTKSGHSWDNWDQDWDTSVQ